MTEASAVESIGRISAADAGIYDDARIDSWRPIANFIREQGAVPGKQLAHARRKASTAVPWTGGKPVTIADGGWEPVGPSAFPFDTGYNLPRELTISEIAKIVAQIRGARWRPGSRSSKSMPRMGT
jgi:2,4-dienoyl-CoA reductase-like NADH-dependent reductase (Old Yellow Enzyme family)